MTANKKILVTGPRGLLGSTLMRTLPPAGYEPSPLQTDITDREATIAEVKKSGAAWVVHTAAKTNVAECEGNPAVAHAVNVLGTQHVLEGARALGANMLHISTVSVFKGDRGNYTEQDTPEPTNTYNRTKYEAEQLVLAYQKGMLLRLNLIGIHPDGSRGRNFLEWLVDSIKADKNINLFSDSFVNPLSNWTIAALIQKNIESDIREQILHIGSSDVLSKEAIGRIVLERFPSYRGTVRSANLDSIQDGVFRPKQMWLNTDLATGYFGPMPNIREELEIIFREETLDGRRVL